MRRDVAAPFLFIRGLPMVKCYCPLSWADWTPRRRQLQCRPHTPGPSTGRRRL